MVTRIAVVSLWAEDVPTTVHFYRDVIGLSLLPHHGEYPHFDLDGSYLVILRGQPVPAQDAEPSHFPIVAFSVSDFDASVARLLDHDIELSWSEDKESHPRWVMFHDPAGNLIELVQFESEN
ncbi:MAG: hypothetical protein AMJ88_18190 [Anaerolineae bacterium SM23_ 63]|nr:MAG: hypothetical protein AMJ88_18190 [Anaerolineae bacterium SM23_ 63]HEY45388.1 hypothetical protein [Anaerolineae bacterium]